MKARRSESVSGFSLMSSRQENVAEPVFNTFSTVWAIRLKGRSVLSSLTLPALDAGEAGFQRAGQSPDAGIAGHDFDQRARRIRTVRSAGRPPPRAGTTARSFQRTPRNRAAEPIRNSRYRPTVSAASALLAALVSSGVGASTTARIGLLAIECLAELVVALAPIQVGRNQGVDVGVDGEVPGCVEARRYRKDECDQDNERGKPRAGVNNRDNNTCQHIFSF